MKEISSTEAKTHCGALLNMAQREPVTIHKKGRAEAVILSMQDFEATPGDEAEAPATGHR
jgi:prevent-host-death family protein